MISTWLACLAALALALLLLRDLGGRNTPHGPWVSSHGPWGWWTATLAPRAWVATLPPAVGPRARRWVLWLLRLEMAGLVVLLLATACAPGQWGLDWTPGVRDVAQTVIGVCLGSVIVLLIASGVGAALHGRSRDEGSA